MNKESFLNQRREIITSTLEEVINSLSFSELDSRVKRTKPSLEYLLHSMTYYYSYAQILKFNAGIYNTDFQNEKYFDERGNLISSGLYYSIDSTGIELIKETEKLFDSDNESVLIEVPEICLKASEIVEDYAPENYQELIDNTIGAFPKYEDEEEYDSRSRFNYLVVQNIERALIRYGESREQTSRELVHSNFRNRVLRVLKMIPGIVISSDKKYYSLDPTGENLLDDSNKMLNLEEKRILKQKLENELKKFDADKKGISRKELEEAQLRRDKGENVNAPQIYRTNDLKKILHKLLSFKVEDTHIKLSKNDLFEIFQRDIERFGQVTQNPSENSIEDYLDNNDFVNFLNENYESNIVNIHEKNNSISDKETFQQSIEASERYKSLLCYVFLTEILFAEDGDLTFKDLHNLRNSCSINNSEGELKTNEKKRIQRFIKVCFDIELNMDSDKVFIKFLDQQKKHLEDFLD